MKNQTKAMIAALTTIASWALAFPLTKYVVQYMEPIYTAELRIFLGGIGLLLVAFAKGIQWPKGRDWILFVFAGLAGNILYQIVFNLGLKTIPSATSSVIVAGTPLLTAIVMQFVYGEKLSTAGWFYTFTAFIGVGIVVLWNGGWKLEVGALWTLGAASMFAFYNVLSRKLSAKGYTGLNVATWAMVLGAVVGLPTLPSAISHVLAEPTSVGAAILALAFLSSALGYGLWSYALEVAEKTSDVINCHFLAPVVAAIFAYFLLGEIPSMGFYIGGTIIIVSLYLFSKYR